MGRMSEVFRYETRVRSDWIDYNGHMRDSFYGLIFSLAVDEMQDEVGVGARHRETTGCTIYLLEDHKVFLREVKAGCVVRVETRVIGVDDKRFHLYKQMFEGGDLVCVGEYMELHVNQHPTPRAEPMPPEARARLLRACLPAEAVAGLPHRARAMGLRPGHQPVGGGDPAS